MSEREVREYAEHKKDCAAHSYMAQLVAECNCGWKQALSAEPDVVVLLRWLTEWRDTYTDKLTGYLYAPPDMAWATIEAAITEIKKTVRLTDDGRWEWVD